MMAVTAFRNFLKQQKPLFKEMDMKSFLGSSEEAKKIIERLKNIDLRRLRADVAAYLFSERRANALINRIEKFIEYSNQVRPLP